jgi:hypothetical protein
MKATIYFFTNHGMEVVENEGDNFLELKEWLFEMAKDTFKSSSAIEVEGRLKFIICNGDMGEYPHA